MSRAEARIAKMVRDSEDGVPAVRSDSDNGVRWNLYPAAKAETWTSREVIERLVEADQVRLVQLDFFEWVALPGSKLCQCHDDSGEFYNWNRAELEVCPCVFPD